MHSLVFTLVCMYVFMSCSGSMLGARRSFAVVSPACVEHS